MGITDDSKIDMILKSGDGPRLLIMDSGEVKSPEQRLLCFQGKIKSYLRFMADDSFRAEHPRWEQAEIVLVSAVEATSEMLDIGGVVYRPFYDEREVTVKISFDNLKSTF